MDTPQCSALLSFTAELEARPGPLLILSVIPENASFTLRDNKFPEETKIPRFKKDF